MCNSGCHGVHRQVEIPLFHTCQIKTERSQEWVLGALQRKTTRSLAHQCRWNVMSWTFCQFFSPSSLFRRLDCVDCPTKNDPILFVQTARCEDHSLTSGKAFVVPGKLGSVAACGRSRSDQISLALGLMVIVKLSSRSSVVWGWRLPVWKWRKALGVWSQDLSSLLPIPAAATLTTALVSSPDL